MLQPSVTRWCAGPYVFALDFFSGNHHLIKQALAAEDEMYSVPYYLMVRSPMKQCPTTSRSLCKIVLGHFWYESNRTIPSIPIELLGGIIKYTISYKPWLERPREKSQATEASSQPYVFVLIFRARIGWHTAIYRSKNEFSSNVTVSLNGFSESVFEVSAVIVKLTPADGGIISDKKKLRK